MADAGKIAPTYDGEWSADKTYDFHTYVTHNNNCYIAKQPSTGVEPTEEDNAYWFLALKNVSAEELSNLQKLIEELENGTTAVGNALQLGGKGASEYLTTNGGTIKNGGTGLSMLRDINGVSRKVSYRVGSAGEPYIEGFTEDGATRDKYMHLRVDKITTHLGDLATTADLANYLPKSGGTIGNGLSTMPLELRGSAGVSHMRFIGSDDEIMGYLGFNGVNNLAYTPSSGSGAKQLLHTGNKPTGTYTGNGSTTARTINIGGIGNALVINGLYTTVWVGNNGAIGFYQDSTEVGILNKSEMFFKDGVLTISTEKGLVNSSGSEFTYQVL